MAKKKTRKDGLRVRTFTYDGKRYYVYGKTNKELNEKEHKKRCELEAGTLERENPTLNEYYERFAEVQRRLVKESTIRNQSCQFSVAAAIPIDGNGKTFGELRIQDITADDLITVQLALADSDRKTATVNMIMAHVKHVFNWAERNGMIEKNPCKGIVNLRKTEKPARETIHRALTLDETTKFENAARERNSYYYNVFELMIMTGMRVGEIGALTPFDIDEKAGVIHVRRTVTKDESGRYKIGDSAKTRTSVRDLPLKPERLKPIKDQMDLNKMMFGARLPQTIFTNEKGELLTGRVVDREIERCCKAAGIDRFASHAFRATFATRFVEQEGDPKTLSAILGHADIGISMNLYAHTTEEHKREVMDRIEIKFG